MTAHIRMDVGGFFCSVLPGTFPSPTGGVFIPQLTFVWQTSRSRAGFSAGVQTGTGVGKFKWSRFGKLLSRKAGAWTHGPSLIGKDLGILVTRVTRVVLALGTPAW